MIRTKIIGSDPLAGMVAASIAGESDMVIVKGNPHVTVIIGQEETLEAGGEVVLVVGSGAERSLLKAVEGGALGYVSDDQPISDVVAAVRTLAAGGASVPDSMLGTLLAHVVRRRRTRGDYRQRLALLTPRENEVFEAAARGLGKEELGAMLFISSETARTHLTNIQKKLGVGSRAELVAFAAELGFDTTKADL